MTQTGFARSLKRVLVHEGGWSNHPRDPGGVTLQGVIQRVYDADRKRRGLAPRPLTAAMARQPEWISERDAIYRRQYWNAVRADELPDGVDYCVFDGAVNSGPVQSGKWLQRALAAAGLYRGSIDGHVGAATLAAALAHPDHDALIEEICRQRLVFLQKLRTWDAFGLGWSRRVRDVKSGAQAWATGAAAPKPTPIPAEEMARGDEASTKVTETPEGKSAADNVTGGTSGGIGASLFGYFDQASLWLTQLSGLPPGWSKWIVGGAIIIAIGVFAWTVGRAGFNLYIAWRDRRAAEKQRQAQSAIVNKALAPARHRRSQRALTAFGKAKEAARQKRRARR